jgi:hypothetical protein
LPYTNPACGKRGGGMVDHHKQHFAHSTYFVLADPHDPATRKKFTDACVRYLSGYVGQLSFGVGNRARDQNRDVNDKNFDVSMDMVFEDYAAYEAYSNDPRHEEFVKEVGDLSSSRRVFDSYLVYPK